MKKKRTSLDSLIEHEEKEDTLPEEEVRKRPRVIQQTLYLPPEVHEQLRRLAFEERRKMHDYLLEGLDQVFADRGLQSIAELRKKKG